MMRRLAMGAALLGATAAAITGCSKEPIVAKPVPNQSLAKPAAPISGGTLVQIGNQLVAADPDTDEVYIVSGSPEPAVRHRVAFEVGDEPGRVIAGPEGTAIVALRRAGRVAVIDLATGEVRRETAVCAEPRGMAYDADILHVACAGGELVSLDADAATVTRKLRLQRDLRDVVALGGGKLAISRFRAAAVTVVDAQGNVTMEKRAQATPGADAAVGWRMRGGPDGVMMLHQLGANHAVPIDRPPSPPSAPAPQSPYGGGSVGPDPNSEDFCAEGPIVAAAATQFSYDQLIDSTEPPPGVPLTPLSGTLGPLVLPVDFDIDAYGNFVAVGAGNDLVVFRNVLDLHRDGPAFNCSHEVARVRGMPVAVELEPGGTAIVQTRIPAKLVRISNHGEPIWEVDLPGPNRRDLGHLVFHKAAANSSPIACASCHPEGREDGRTWAFEEVGLRRTQTVAGGVLDTAPLHWDAEFDGLEGLMTEVFVDRMGGAEPGPEQLEALGGWLNQLPHLHQTQRVNDAAVERGEALYWDDTVGCGDCHDGTKLTNHQTVHVGTGQALQVPSLTGIMDRAPFMHDGCAPDMKSRFTDPTCGGGDLHGVTSHLTDSEIDDLIAYLETL